jgi:hypothetical protein
LLLDWAGPFIVQSCNPRVKHAGALSSVGLTDDIAGGVPVSFNRVNMLLSADEPRVHGDYRRVRDADVTEFF